MLSAIAFEPNSTALATLEGTGNALRIWDINTRLLSRSAGRPPLRYTSAKPPQGQRRDVVLWDFGGQDEYRLVHQLFLHDTTLALVLIDPTRGRTALDEARDWNKRLEKHLGDRKAVKLLVGAKQDKKSDLIGETAIRALCKECGFADFIDVSAKSNRKIATLRKAIANALDWDTLAKTSRPELFQRIRDDVERRRKRREVVLLLDKLKRGIKRASPKLYEEAAVKAVADQLATQGVIAQTRLASGNEALVLQLPVVERYAGSLIVAARNNPRGVPVLEERLLGLASDIPLPGMKKKERLKGQKERIVLECVVELMIQHGICFRHGGLLVFPTLFPTGDGDAEKLPHSVSLYYDFTGAIGNIYASLVSKLMVSEEFGEGRLRAGRVEFDRPGKGVCGIRQIRRTGGLSHVDLFFAEKTQEERRDLFTRFVEEHLRLNGVDIREHQAVKCQCGKMIEEDDVQANIAAGERDVICPRCRKKTPIGEGAERIRERDPESDRKILALRKEIDERTADDVASAKKAVAGSAAKRKSGQPIRLLHLSDLHFSAGTSVQSHLVALLQDVHEGEHLGFESVEYLVISGDMTDQGSDKGFEKARDFVDRLIGELGLSSQRCIFVPGNHDVQEIEEAYCWFGAEEKARNYDSNEQNWHREGKVVFVADRDQYRNRFRMFSDAFFHKIVPGEPYPLNPDEQGTHTLDQVRGSCGGPAGHRLGFLSYGQVQQRRIRRHSGEPPAAELHLYVLENTPKW